MPNNKIDIGIELKDICISGSGASVFEALCDATMNAVIPTRLVGANSSRANAGFYVSEKDETHVLLSLKCGFNSNVKPPQRKGKQLAIKPAIVDFDQYFVLAS